MKLRKWLWIGAGTLCAVALVMGYLARPANELGEVMRLHPTILDTKFSEQDIPDYEGTWYVFSQSAAHVSKLIPGKRSKTTRTVVIDTWNDVTPIELPDGRRARLSESGGADPRTGCLLIVHSDNRPWYQKAWATLKSRLGL